MASWGDKETTMNKTLLGPNSVVHVNAGDRFAQAHQKPTVATDSRSRERRNRIPCAGARGSYQQAHH